MELVVNGSVRVLQVDRTTWLAELVDLDDDIQIVRMAPNSLNG